MAKRSNFIITFEIYMEHFTPLEIYNKLGVRPIECKMKQKAPISVPYKDWQKILKEYEEKPESNLKDEENKLDSIKLPAGFYKISSKVLHIEEFRKECDRFCEKLEKKLKIILKIKEEKNAFMVFRIQTNMAKNDHIALNLSSKIAKLCSKLNARIVSEIKNQ